MEIAAIEAKLATLQRMRKALGELVTACASRGRTQECPILEALEDGAENAGEGADES